MQSLYYPYAEFSFCNPDDPADPFPSRVYRYARGLDFLLKQSNQIDAGTSDFFVAEEAFLARLRRQHSALTRATGLRCTIVDEVLDQGEANSGWSIEGCPLLVGVALQIEQIVNPDVLRAQTILSKCCEVFVTGLARTSLEVTVYDSRDSEKLSLAALRNTSLMAALAAPMVTYDLPSLRRTTVVKPQPTSQMEERIRLVAEQRERSIHTGTWMLASANFGTFSLQQVRRTLIDLALSSTDEEAARDVLETALHGSRSELIAFAEQVAGPLN